MSLKALIVEDLPADAELVAFELERATKEDGYYPWLNSQPDNPRTADGRTTARSVLADIWRQRHGTVLMEFDDERDAAQPADPEHEVDVSGLLDGLPSNYRSVLEYRFLRGYSIRETAAAMGVSIANAKVLQLRALRRAAASGGGDVQS